MRLRSAIPPRALNHVPPGDYWVQGVFNIYETFHLGNGRTVKLPPDKGEGQHWQVKPGNLYSKPQKVRIDHRSRNRPYLAHRKNSVGRR